MKSYDYGKMGKIWLEQIKEALNEMEDPFKGWSGAKDKETMEFLHRLAKIIPSLDPTKYPFPASLKRASDLHTTPVKRGKTKKGDDIVLLRTVYGTYIIYESSVNYKAGKDVKTWGFVTSSLRSSKNWNRTKDQLITFWGMPEEDALKIFNKRNVKEQQ